MQGRFFFWCCMQTAQPTHAPGPHANSPLGCSRSGGWGVYEEGVIFFFVLGVCAGMGWYGSSRFAYIGTGSTWCTFDDHASPVVSTDSIRLSVWCSPYPTLLVARSDVRATHSPQYIFVKWAGGYAAECVCRWAGEGCVVGLAAGLARVRVCGRYGYHVGERAFRQPCGKRVCGVGGWAGIRIGWVSWWGDKWPGMRACRVWVGG